MAAWIFQGSPDKFDIDDYVSRYPELIYWRTPRYAKEIATGDLVFLWRSGAKAGVVAVGTVVELPTPANRVLHPEALGDDLWRAEPPDADEPKTGIHLDQVRLADEEGFLSKDAVKSDSTLSGATIIRMPTGTVFPLTLAQQQALERLLGTVIVMEDSLLPSASAMEGRQALHAHRRRERSSALRLKKLSRARAIDGACSCAICGITETSTYPPPLGSRVFEVHHRTPLRMAATAVRTTLDDLAVLCASCHRAVHATSDVEENYSTLSLHFRSRRESST